MTKHVVNDWYQIEWEGKQLTGGDTFNADREAVTAAGLDKYVSVVEEKAKEPAENKAQASAPNKAASSRKRTTKK